MMTENAMNANKLLADETTKLGKLGSSGTVPTAFASTQLLLRIIGHEKDPVRKKEPHTKTWLSHQDARIIQIPHYFDDMSS